MKILSKKIKQQVSQAAQARLWLPVLGVGCMSQLSGPAVASDYQWKLEEIVVTARKVEESIQEIPLAISAFSETMLKDSKINSVADLSEIIPNMVVADSGSTTNPAITLRGVSSTTTYVNAAAESAVSINIDGVQFSSAYALRLAQFDIAQIEVLKGPQALFYGKNSPGGIIAIKSKKPTEELFAEVQAGYEGVASNSAYGHAIVSGPIADGLSVRQAIKYSDTDGMFENTYPGVNDSDLVGFREVLSKTALRWDVSSDLLVDALIIYASREGGAENATQISDCDGSPLLGGAAFSDCKLNDKVAVADPDQDPTGVFDSALSQTGLWGQDPFHERESIIAALNAQWDINDTWGLASVTSYYDMENTQFSNMVQAFHFVMGREDVDRAFSQEFRLSGNFDSLRLMAGVYYDNRRYHRLAESYTSLAASAMGPLSSLAIAYIAPAEINIDSNAYSVFAQVQYDINDQLEIAIGGRYTDERKVFDAKWVGNGVPDIPAFGLDFARDSAAGRPWMVLNPDNTYNNFSPEATISYRPTSDMMLYASYKEGFKSGGYNVDIVTPGNSAPGNTSYYSEAVKNDFDEESAEGFELGLKSEWLDSRLRVNASVYSFTFKDMQDANVRVIPGVGLETLTENSAESKSEGAEVDITYISDVVEGLILTSSFAYTDARYEDRVARCSDWQLSGLNGADASRAIGCDIDSDGDTVADSTRLDGVQLAWAPEYAFSVGGSYEFELGSDLGMRLNLQASWRDDHHGRPYGNYDPRTRVEDYWLFNAGVSLFSRDERWSLDIIGKNIFDERSPVVMGPALGAQNPLVPLAVVSTSPRQVSVQLTYRPF